MDNSLSNLVKEKNDKTDIKDINNNDFKHVESVQEKHTIIDNFIKHVFDNKIDFMKYEMDHFFLE